MAKVRNSHTYDGRGLCGSMTTSEESYENDIMRNNGEKVIKETGPAYNMKASGEWRIIFRIELYF